jgi:hypothetical protein
MHDTRLIKILKTFSVSEFKNFGKFIASPYFTTGRDLTPLYRVLKKFYPEFTGKGLEKEKVFTKLGKGKYNEQLMRIMISGLYKMAVEYLKNLSVMASPVKTNLMLSESAIARGLFFLAEQHINEAEEMMPGDGIDSDYFENRFEIENRKTDYNFFSDTTLYRGSMEKIASEHTIFNFLMLASNHLHNLYSIKTNINTDYSDYMLINMLKNSQLEMLEPQLSGSKDKDAARIFLYYILTHISSGEEHYFYKLKELLTRHLKYFVPSERRFLLLLYDSLCTKKMFDTDFEKFTVERLEAKKKMIAEGMFRRQPPNFISPVRFYSVIITGIAAGDHEWVEKMLKEHTGDLAPEHRESLSNYFKAEICFLKKKFEGSLSLAGKIDLTTFFLKPTIYALQLKIYYELNYVDEALSIIDTFRHYIANNKQATTIIRKMRTDFLKFYKKLLFYKSGKRIYSLEQLKGEHLDPATLHRKWLEKKLNELE